ncbi:MAG: DUF5696 domain-containing protein [Bacillota bacterium]
MLNPTVFAASDLPGYEIAAENAGYRMYFNQTNADVVVKNKTTGEKWSSFPADWEKDPVSMGFLKMKLASQIILDTLNPMEQTTESANSYVNCVRQGNFTGEPIPNGIRINYDFVDMGIKISLEFQLTKDGFTACVPMKSVKDTPGYRITRISVLPFLGASTYSDKGYLFIPDGSGSIIDFSDNFSKNYLEVVRPVYGREKSTPIREKPGRDEIFRLPVFGIKKNNQAFIAIIEKGDAWSNIHAAVSGYAFGYFRVFSSYTYKDVHQIVLFEGGMRDRNNERTESERERAWLSPVRMGTDIKISYHLLSGADADYAGMAEVYRNYIIKKWGMRKNTSGALNFNLTLLGGYKMRKLVLGLPMTVVEPLTTFPQSVQILKALKEQGVDKINLKFMGFNEGGYRDRITDAIRPEGALGGAGALKRLIDYTVQNKIALFLNAELLEVTTAGNGFALNRDAARQVTNAIAFQWYWNMYDQRKAVQLGRWQIISPARLLDFATEFTASLKKNKLQNIALESIGDMLYSDYRNKRVILRDKTIDYWHKTLNWLSKETSRTMVTGGSGYTLPYVTDIVNIPMENSNFDIETEPVPFLQMVIHGYIPYSGNPANLSDDTRIHFLRMLEYGALPHYQWIFKPSSAMRLSKMNYFYSGHYNDWLTDAVNDYKVTQDLYKHIYNKKMIGHERIASGVYKTIYENGVAVYVNYNEPEVNIPSIGSNAGNFLLKTKGYYIQRGGNR